NIDDPNFRLGRVIWHAVGNVLTKVATAPFTLLGKLFGGGSDKLDVVDFEPGAPALAGGAEKTLRALAKALYSRPALRLDLEGSADETADGRALRLAELHRRAQEAKWKALGNRSGAASPDKIELLEDEYPKFIETTYRNTPRAQATATPAGGAAAGTGRGHPGARNRRWAKAKRDRDGGKAAGDDRPYAGDVPRACSAARRGGARPNCRGGTGRSGAAFPRRGRRARQEGRRPPRILHLEMNTTAAGQ